MSRQYGNIILIHLEGVNIIAIVTLGIIARNENILREYCKQLFENA